MKMYFLFFVFTLIVFCNGSISDVPQIDSVNLSEDGQNTVEVTWNMPNAQNYTLTRYRVFYREYNHATIYEWPAQISKVQYSMNDSYPPINILNATSNFDCYNRCIQDPKCVYVIMKHKKYDNCFHHANHSTATLIGTSPNQESFEISQISNLISLKNLPTHHQFFISLILYDQNSDQWTDISNSKLIDLRINLTVEAVPFLTNALLVSWMDTGLLTSAALSRCHLYTSINGVNSTPSSISPISTYNLQPRYYDSFTTPGTFVLHANDEQSCLNYCLNYKVCVFYAFIRSYDDVSGLDANSCVLKNKLNIAEGLYGYNNITAQNFITTVNHWRQENTNLSSNYTFSLECLTPYGDTVTSDVLNFKYNKIPMNISVDNDTYNLVFEIKFDISDPNFDESSAAVLIQYAGLPYINYNLFVENSHITYNDSEAYFVSLAQNQYECFELCSFNSSCKAMRYGSAPPNFGCYLIKNLVNPINCSGFMFCATKMNYEKKIRIELTTGYHLCFNAMVITPNASYVYDVHNTSRSCSEIDVKISLNTSTEIENLEEGGSVDIYCQFTSINDSLIRVIDWSFNGLVYSNLPLFDSELLDGNRTLHIKRLNQTAHHGNYACRVTLINGALHMSSTITLTMKYPLKLTVLSENVVTTVSTNIQVRCSIDGYPIEKLSWKFLKNESFVPPVSQINPNIFVMSLANISRNENGTYMCFVTTNSSIYGLLDITVNSKPSQPEITFYEEIDNVVHFKWSVEDDGGLEFKVMQIEIADNFPNATQDYRLITVLYNTTFNNEFNFTNDKTTQLYFRIKLSNNLGFSDPSEPKLITNSQIPTTTHASENPPKDNSLGTYFILFLCTLGLLLAVVITIVIVKIKRKAAAANLEKRKSILSFNFATEEMDDFN